MTKNDDKFSYKLPFAQKTITFKLLTHGDDVKIQNEIKGLQKYNKQFRKNINSSEFKLNNKYWA